ncbi:unnamed protein product [Nezara viridula]|uniref:Uncharacterized protein n=1 Tax=Nezara viridula TaxID=85310 RepID=A0A9P0MYG7_NEZVI|nr:unnamed protein product [Nezara viridula]
MDVRPHSIFRERYDGRPRVRAMRWICGTWIYGIFSTASSASRRSSSRRRSTTSLSLVSYLPTSSPLILLR